jgi:hypothetical protein
MTAVKSGPVQAGRVRLDPRAGGWAMTITPVGFNPRAGKTIELQHRPPEPDGSPMDPFAPLFLVAPDAVDTVQLYRNNPWYVFGVKSTDRDDTILIDGEVWYHTISIDGGGGHNVIEGTFGYNKYGVIQPPPIFTPAVRNVQWALLESLNPHVQLDFRNWTGLSYVEATHRVPLYPVTNSPNVGKPITEFINIPTDAELGVANFNDTAKFHFVPQPPNSIGVRGVVGTLTSPQAHEGVCRSSAQERR